MKRCPKCNDMAIYDDSVERCPICDTILTQFHSGTGSSAQIPVPPIRESRPPHTRRVATPITETPPSGGDVVGEIPLRPVVESIRPRPRPHEEDEASGQHPYNERTERRRTGRAEGVRAQHPPQFERVSGRDYIFRGRIAEVSSHSRYYNRFHKVVNAVFRGEPYQFGHSSYETVMRVEEFTDGRLPTQYRDLVMYGDIEAAIHVGDDVEVHAVQRGGRYVIRGLHNNHTESDVVPGPQLSMQVCALIMLAAVALVAGIIYGMYAFFFKGGFEALVMAVVNLIISIILQFLPLIALIFVSLAILSLFTGIGRRR